MVREAPVVRLWTATFVAKLRRVVPETVAEAQRL
jgi:hypothetical protein